MADESQNISPLSSLNEGEVDPLAVLKGIQQGAKMINTAEKEYAKVHKTFLALAGGDETKAKEYEYYTAGLTGVGAYYGVKKVIKTGIKTGIKGIIKIIKNPVESAAITGGTILGAKAIGAVTDRLGYTTDISDIINQYDPTILGVNGEDAAKYFTLGGVGYKNAKNTFKGFNELRTSESYLADLAQQGRLNKMMGMLRYSDVPVSYSDYASRGGKGVVESIESTANMAGKAAGEGFKSTPILDAASKSGSGSGLKTVAKYSAILGKYTKLLPELSMAWDSVNTAIYAAQGDNEDAALKAFEIADQALWLLGPEAGIASLGVNYLIDRQIDRNREKTEEKNAGQGKNKKGITINEKGTAIIPKNADALTQEEAIKYATKGREIYQTDNEKWYLVDENKEKRIPEKMEISAPKNLGQAPPEVTLEYISPKSPENQTTVPSINFDTPQPSPTPTLKVPPVPPLPSPTPTPRPTLSVPPTLKPPQKIETYIEVPSVLEQDHSNRQTQIMSEIRDSINKMNNEVAAGKRNDVNIIGGNTSSNQTTHIHVGSKSIQEYRKTIRPLLQQ